MEHPHKAHIRTGFFSLFETLSKYYLLMFMSALWQRAMRHEQQLPRPGPLSYRPTDEEPESQSNKAMHVHMRVIVGKPGEPGPQTSAGLCPLEHQGTAWPHPEQLSITSSLSHAAS